MKNIKFFLLSIILSSSLFIAGCGTTPVIPEPVCNYGGIICDFTEELCSSGAIPSDICFYITLSCANLELLCNSELTTDQREQILETQNKLNNEFNSYIKQRNKINE